MKDPYRRGTRVRIPRHLDLGAKAHFAGKTGRVAVCDADVTSPDRSIWVLIDGSKHLVHFLPHQLDHPDLANNDIGLGEAQTSERLADPGLQRPVERELL